MTQLTIEQTNALIEYFQGKLQDYLEIRKYLDTTTTRDDLENILDKVVN